jgi:hypothetical protein
MGKEGESFFLFLINASSSSQDDDQQNEQNERESGSSHSVSSTGRSSNVSHVFTTLSAGFVIIHHPASIWIGPTF